MTNFKKSSWVLTGLLLFTMEGSPALVLAEGTANAPAAPAIVKKRKKVRNYRRIKAKAQAPKRSSTARASVVAPAPEDPNTFQGWLQQLRKRIARTQAKQNQIVAVASVRGNETPDAPPLYWKGKASAGIVEGSDLHELDEALTKAAEGDTVAAKMRLESFIATHGQSPLLADAQETLKKLDEQSVTTAEAKATE